MSEAPFSEVKDFIRRQRSAGRYKATTGQALEAACTLVAGLLEPGRDSVDYVQNHVDDLIQRYGNLNRKVSKASLNTYRHRVSRAIGDYIGHRTDPQWQPPGRAKPKRKSVPTAQSLHAQAVGASILSGSLAEESAESAPNALRHRLPLRPEFDVEILLPRDFNAKEARRVTAWISALAGALTDEAGE